MKSKPNSRQKTITGVFTEKKIIPQVKTPCKFCKVKIFDLEKHESNCHRNPANVPKTNYDWEYFEEYSFIEEFLIKNPTTKKMKEFNHILAPKGNPFEHILDAMLPYMNTLPKNVLERQMQAKFETDFTRGIELRLLNDEEFIQRIEDRLKKGHKFTFLMDKPEDVSVRDWIAKVEKISYK